MADEEAPGNVGGVHDVNAQQSQNIRLVIGVGGDRTAVISFKGKLILQNSGPPHAAAAAGDAAPGNAGQGQSAADAEVKEFLDKMRGWLMTVGTLFVTMAFQAALQPPAWLRTADFLRFGQSDIDQSPSPSPSPQAAESATAGLSGRAKLYMYLNYCTFGTSLALVLMLMLLQNKPPRQAMLIMWVAKVFLAEISLCVVGTVVLGTSEDWRYMLFAVGVIGALASFTLLARWLVSRIFLK